MVLKETSVCNFGEKAIDFNLPGVDGRQWSFSDCTGEKGTLIMFICNHCPYVKAIQIRLVEDMLRLKELKIGCAAIMSNDPADYPEDSFENMQIIAEKFNFPFPYLFDESQEVAKAYGAICTPDFFGYNSSLELQYRGRLDDSGENPADPRRELVEAMTEIARTGIGPQEQIPAIGCSIKWK